MALAEMLVDLPELKASSLSSAMQGLRLLVLLLDSAHHLRQTAVDWHAIAHPWFASIGQSIHDAGDGIGTVLAEIRWMIDQAALRITLEAYDLRQRLIVLLSLPNTPSALA